MTYRNISVNGRQYEYVIGATYLKVKGLDPVSVEKVGQVWDVIKLDDGTEKKLYTVTPKNVRDYIQSFTGK